MKLIIGLEIHCQLKTNSKLFCECSTEKYLEAEPNSLICEVCTGQPGAKPYGINEEALHKAIKIALALNCKVIAEEPIYFQRKHYIYPDLPSNYQRTSKPIGLKGELAGIRIRECHLEEDPGRYNLKTGKVDYNRSGMPLIEIVTEPDFSSPEQAGRFLEELNAILEYLEVGRDEPGSTRVDANLSFEGHARTEVKNINSFKGVVTALSYEAMRQKNRIAHGMEVTQETRHFDEEQGITIGLRKKETVDDYRYFPDPDIPPIVLEKDFVESIKKEIPELPEEKRKRFSKQYGINQQEAFVLTLEKEFAEFFEEVCKKISPKIASTFMVGVLRKQLNYRNTMLKNTELKKEDLIELLELFEKKEITIKSAEKLLICILEEKVPLKNTSKYNEFIGIIDKHSVEKAVKQAIKENPSAVKDYKKGVSKAMHFLFGEVMKLTKGKAEPSEVVKALKKEIDNQHVE